VAVADFANEADDNDLDGLPEMLITSLEQSRRLLILTRSRMVDVLVQMGRSEVRLGTSPVNHTPGEQLRCGGVLHEASAQGLVAPAAWLSCEHRSSILIPLPRRPYWCERLGRRSELRNQLRRGATS